MTSLLDGAVHAFDGARDYAREHVALPRLAISPILGEIPPSVAHTWRAVGDAAAPSVRAVKDEVGELLEKLGKGGAATARGIGDMLGLHRAEVVLDLSVNGDPRAGDRLTILSARGVREIRVLNINASFLLTYGVAKPARARRSRVARC